MSNYKQNCTKGPVEVSKMRLGPNEKDRRSGFVVNGPDTGSGMLPARICDMRCHDDTQYAATKANAELIAEAFNVLAETGMTPRELADQKAFLFGALERLAPMFNNDSKLLDVYEDEIQYAQHLLSKYRTAP